VGDARPVKFLIINADDLGCGAGVNRGIAELHDEGIVTSAGLMVNGPGTEDAVRLAAERPQLSLGLHVTFTNEATRLVDLDDAAICGTELRRQFDRFVELTGKWPTHLDGHQHVHRRRTCQASFLEVAEEYGLPLRGHPPVTFKGGFYGQWEYGVSQRSLGSFEALSSILSAELTHGIYELAVHPGYWDAAAQYVYHREREWELETLADPRLPGLLAKLGIRLISYHHLGEAAGELAADRSA
jgi:chitin disaccharide deacetylase